MMILFEYTIMIIDHITSFFKLRVMVLKSVMKLALLVIFFFLLLLLLLLLLLRCPDSQKNT